MRRLVVAGLMMYACGVLCGCGQKGPLVLPDAPKRKHTIPTLPGTAAPQGTSGSAPPAQSSPAATPPPPASPAAPQPP